MEKKSFSKNYPAFGARLKRFDTLGVHPKLIRQNTSNPLGPGQYTPKYFECEYKKDASNWKTKLESEEFSKYLGFRLPCLLAERHFDNTLRGPQTLDPVNLSLKKGATSFDNVGFGKAKRFVTFFKDKSLPPGTYNVRKPITKFSKIPTLEYGGLGSRFKNTEPQYRLAPNRYNIPRPLITDKVVSKRGPYDTFTGPRDQTSIKNHFAPPLFRSPDVFYPIPNALDELLFHPSKQRCGKFLQSERFPEGATIKATKNGFCMFEKDQNYPGPSQYEVSMGIKAEKETPHPFQCSNINARPPIDWCIHPGPDRYFIKYPKCLMKKGQKQSWMFTSNEQRDLFRKESYSNFIY